MKITKIGHSCLVVEEQGVKVLIDPGSMSTGQNEVTGINAVLITHEHQDHLSLESLKKVLGNNPGVVIIANSAIGAILEKEGIAYTKVTDSEETEVKGLVIKGSGKEHAIICDGLGSGIENTGYFIGPRFFYPGDAFHNPDTPVEILALPVGGPWMKVSEAINYARAVKPAVCFPVHDGMFKPEVSFFDRMGPMFLTPADIGYVPMKDGDTKEF